MHKTRIYIDTSVIGGCFDEIFMEWSIKLYDEFISGNKIAVISDITFEELEYAPDFVKNLLNKIPSKFKEIIMLDDEAKDLSNCYLKEGIVTIKSLMDTRHIALATIHKVDVLASWNFKHIVNYNKIQLYNSVNIKQGYSYIEIRNPRDLADEKE